MTPLALLEAWQSMFDHKDSVAWIQEEVDRTNKHHDGTAVHNSGSYSQVVYNTNAIHNNLTFKTR